MSHKTDQYTVIYEQSNILSGVYYNATLIEQSGIWTKLGPLLVNSIIG